MGIEEEVEVFWVPLVNSNFCFGRGYRLGLESKYFPRVVSQNSLGTVIWCVEDGMMAQHRAKTGHPRRPVV